MFLNHLYGGINEPEMKIIDVFVYKLRKKILRVTGGKNYIETIWGSGYVLRVAEGESDPKKTPKRSRNRRSEISESFMPKSVNKKADPSTVLPFSFTALFNVKSVTSPLFRSLPSDFFGSSAGTCRAALLQAGTCL